MNPNIKKITAAILAVILLVGVLPYVLTKILSPGAKGQNLQVRVSMPNGEITQLPLEEYLIGVVAAEMPAEFESEALKAQAVAARTYVIKKMGDKKITENTFDVDTTEKTQAWNSNKDMFRKWGILSYFKYHSKIAKAVEATEGKILTYNGKMIDAVYHSSCGRKNTEKSSDVWSGDVGYLDSVPSGEVTPLRFVKHQVFDVTDFYKFLGFTQIPAQFNENDLIVIERSKSGRVKSLAVRNKVIQGTEFRVKLGLPSTDFEWMTQGKKIEFITYGKGHGVGMSQYGANDLAKAGEQYNEILGHYYEGTKLEKVY